MLPVVFSSGGWQLLFTDLQPMGFPHSDMRGLTVVCTSPRFFAAYHVLRRPREDRIQYANSQAAGFLGAELADLNGMPRLEKFPPNITEKLS